MAFNFEQGDSDELNEQHEINVTPFIDVILVLLIIFMVAAPIATVSVPVNLPQIEAEKQTNTEETIYITLKQDHSLVLGDELNSTIDAIAELMVSQGINKQQNVLLRADEQVNYGEFIKLLNQLNQAGYTKVGLVGLEGTAQ